MQSQQGFEQQGLGQQGLVQQGLVGQQGSLQTKLQQKTQLLQHQVMQQQPQGFQQPQINLSHLQQQPR